MLYSAYVKYNGFDMVCGDSVLYLFSACSKPEY